MIGEYFAPKVSTQRQLISNHPCSDSSLLLLGSQFRATRAAGAGGGLVASIATCPLDVVKTKLQAQQFTRGQAGYEGILGEGLY